MADFYTTGNQPKNQESIECGKHIGACVHCGFTLLADKDEKCPRCEAPIKKEKSDA